MQNDSKNLVMAIGLSAVILFAWQFFFAPKHVEQPKAQETASQVTKAQETKPSTQALPFEKQFYKLERGQEIYSLANDLTVADVFSSNSKRTFKEVVGVGNPFSIEVVNSQTQKAEVLKVNFSNVSPNEISGVAEGLGINVSGKILENGRLSLSLKSTTPYKYRLVFRSFKEEGENRKHREFIFLTKSTQRHAVNKSFNDEEKVKWVGIDHKFHLATFILPEKLQAKVNAVEDSNTMTVDLAEPTTDFKGDFLFTIKNYDELTKMGDNLKLAVDFGVFGILAVPILRGLQFFYNWIPNYGWCIVVLTLLIRTITYPLQYKSFKSMKKMQEIQPELNKIKEKYKSDPQKMQKETMALFKKAGANPLGGCLPILIQMPVFFAFYKVLGEAIELVGAPYIFWIKDLSHKDPFFVLPVLMTAAMWLQQKYTPTTTMEPTQKKIMMFMPLIFGFIMKDLPSGLVLYIFVSTLFGIIQQFWVYRTTN